MGNDIPAKIENAEGKLLSFAIQLFALLAQRLSASAFDSLVLRNLTAAIALRVVVMVRFLCGMPSFGFWHCTCLSFGFIIAREKSRDILFHGEAFC